MRIHHAIIAASIASLASCASHTQVAVPAAPQTLATWKGGSIDQNRWNDWKKNSNVPSTPNEEEAAFNEYVRLNLDALAAADEGIAKDSAKSKRWTSIIDRILSDVLRRDYITLQAAFPDSAIRKWASTQDSATRKLPLDSLRARGGKALLLAGIKLDSVYSANKSQFTRDNRKPIVPGWDSARIAQALATKLPPNVPAPRIALGNGDSISVDSLRNLSHNPYTHESVQLPFDSARTSVQDVAYRALLEKLAHEYLPKQREKFAVKTIAAQPPPVHEDSLKQYWKAHKERWWTEPVYQLSALSSKDSAALAKALSKVKDLVAFKKLATRFPVGTPAAPNGELGRVKNNFSLPYGVGMAPTLFSRLDTTKVGHLVAPVRANDSLFIAVWLENRDSGSIKPFESVRSDVQAAYAQTHPYTPPPSTVVATWDKGNLFTKADVDFISEEIPPQARRNFPPERVLDFMLNWAVAGRTAREVGLLERESTKLILAENEINYLAQEFRSSPTAQTFLFPKKAADSALAAWSHAFGKSWTADSVKGIDRDGARLLLLQPGELERTYQTGIDKYRKDSLFLPIDSVREQIFVDLRPTLDERGLSRIDSVLKSRYEFKLAPAAPQSGAKSSPKAILDSARAKHDNRHSLAEAENLYRQVERAPLAADSLRAQALFQLGQLYGEQTNYTRSLEAYRSVLARFPKSSEAYKAQFMIAFTYSEYLKVDKIAVAEYQKVKDNYPTCDLFNDADWMIRNIQSGGQLMPKFDDSAFVADSIARTDSLKKHGVKDTAKTDSAKAAKKVVAPAKADAAKATAKIDSTKAGHPARDSAAAAR